MVFGGGKKGVQSETCLCCRGFAEVRSFLIMISSTRLVVETPAMLFGFRNGLTCARLCGDQEIELKSLCNLATVLKERKKLIEASDLYRQCIVLCKLYNKKYSAVEKQAMYEIAKCLIDSGMPHRGLAVLDRAIILAESRSVCRSVSQSVILCCQLSV